MRVDVHATVLSRRKGIRSLITDDLSKPRGAFDHDSDPSISRDRVPTMRLRSSAKWKHELIEATRFAIPWPVRSILGELPLEISDPLSSIPANPYWWMDPRLHSAVADINVEVSAIVACAIGLVRGGYRPTTWVCNEHEQNIDELQLLARNYLNPKPTGTCLHVLHAVHDRAGSPRRAVASHRTTRDRRLQSNASVAL